MLQQPQLPPADLVTEASRYRGLHYRYIIALLRDPDQTDADVARSIGIASDTPASWWPPHPDLRDLRDRIRASQSLRQEYARAAMLAAVPDAVDTLIAVATNPKARDGQRARERILEQTGVLTPSVQRVATMSVQVDAAMLKALADPEVQEMLERLAQRMLPPISGQVADTPGQSVSGT